MLRKGIRFALSVLAAVAVAAPAQADVTGTWTVGATTATTLVRGIQVGYSGDPGNPYTNETLATAAWWTNPYSGTVSGAAALGVTVGTADPYAITVTFDEPVNNPVVHIDRMGGNNGGPNSSIWTLTSATAQSGSVTLTKLSGNDRLSVVGNVFRRDNVGVTGGTDCAATGNTAACGSIQFNGTGITQLVFSITMTANEGAGDALEMKWSFVGSNIIVRKQSVGGTGTFNFTGSTDITAFGLNTGVTNPATSATFTVGNHAAPITITEAAAAGFTLTQASCVDQSSATVASSLAGQVLTIADAAYDGNDTITCTFVNTQQQQLNLVKVWNNAVTGHTISATTSGGAANATVSSTAPTGTSGATATMLAGNSVTLPAETFGGGAVAANYTSTVACAGGTTLAASTPPQTITIANSATATTCTYTNSRIGQQLNLAKNWVNGRSGDSITVTTTGGTANPTLNSPAPTNTNGAAVTVYAGDVVTLPAETFSGGSGVTTLYTATVACAGGSTLASGATGRTITVTNSTTATACTYTNTRLQANLTTVKTRTSSSPALTGSTVTFQIVVTNAGPVTATNVALNDIVPAGLSVTGVSASAGTASNTGNNVSWSVASLANGSSATITINATIN